MGGGGGRGRGLNRFYGMPALCFPKIITYDHNIILVPMNCSGHMISFSDREVLETSRKNSKEIVSSKNLNISCHNASISVSVCLQISLVLSLVLSLSLRPCFLSFFTSNKVI